MKTLRFLRCCAIFAAVLTAIGAGILPADEGMWLFSDPPSALLKAKYGFEPTGEWLRHLQQSSVRFNNGGSGSFVSADGLVMTNHHVGFGALQKLSTRDRDLVETGFYARSRSGELKCHDLELNVLVRIEDVTERVREAVRSESDPEKASLARRAVMNTIEKESFEKTGLRSDVVTLYRGGLYHLYCYRRYTDVRLVFAPEQAIAFFGGDPDNFEYPRYDLDVCFFRVYENDRPAKVEHFLKWSESGAADGELVFVSGHPGRTDRLNTLAHLEFYRDRVFPFRLDEIRRREVLLSIFSERSGENARRAKRELFGYKNRRKAYLGMLAGLQDPAVIQRKRVEEAGLRQGVLADPSLRQSCGDAWDQVVAAVDVWKAIYLDYHLLEDGAAFDGSLFDKARTLVRLAEESQKPNDERLREYRESNLPSVTQQLYSEAPIYKDLETVLLADSLGMYVELAGANDPMVLAVLAGKSPQSRAAELVSGTRLDDVAERKRLAEGGRAAIDAGDDPMIQLARLIDPPARDVRRRYEEQVDERLRGAYEKIAKARFALAGEAVYPDATFSLRLAYGVVKGYAEMGRQVPPWTLIGGAYEHAAEHGGEPPFQLPDSWIRHKQDLDLDAPMNFVSTCDIIGGNSGSPVVNRAGEVVGLVFDGNIQSLVWDFVYGDAEGRATSVHSSAIPETLRNVYDAAPLADELGR
jgi:hypothetical protein